MGEDVVGVVQNFFNHNAPIESINKTFILPSSQNSKTLSVWLSLDLLAYVTSFLKSFPRLWLIK